MHACSFIYISSRNVVDEIPLQHLLVTYQDGMHDVGEMHRALTVRALCGIQQALTTTNEGVEVRSLHDSVPQHAPSPGMRLVDTPQQTVMRIIREERPLNEYTQNDIMIGEGAGDGGPLKSDEVINT